MPKYLLEWKLETKNVTKIKPQSEDFQWCFDFSCSKCHEVSGSVSFRGIDEVEISNSRGTANLVMKCKFCKSEGTVEIIQKSLQPFIEDQPGFQALVALECRGFEPSKWFPVDKFTAEGTETLTRFEDIDLNDDFCDYDEKNQESIEIMNLESRVTRCK